MVTLATVDAQLRQVGCYFRFWGRAELRELCQILLPGEKIAQAVNGQYEAGFAMLVATDFRVLLIDKKPKYLTLKDIRYDMITELDFSGRMMNSTVRIYTPNKELKFTTTSGRRLRTLFNHTQHKVMEIRHRFMMQQFQQQHEIANTPPGIAMMQHYNQPLPYGSMPAPAFEPPQAAYALDEKGAVAAAPDELMGAGQMLAGQADIDTQSDARGDGLYNPAASTPDAKQRLRAAMGHAGLRSIVHNGQIIREYMTVPFQQRWKRRPYGFRRDPIGGQHLPSA